MTETKIEMVKTEMEIFRDNLKKAIMREEKIQAELNSLKNTTIQNLHNELDKVHDDISEFNDFIKSVFKPYIPKSMESYVTLICLKTPYITQIKIKTESRMLIEWIMVTILYLINIFLL